MILQRINFKNILLALKYRVRKTQWVFVLRRWRAKKVLIKWYFNRQSGPVPHEVKEKILFIYAQKFACQTLVETGTYLGEMVAAAKKRFRKIYSIELSPDLFAEAKEMFKKYGHITILQGDSGEVLKNLVPRLSGSCLFWLDGHFSGGLTAQGASDTPIMQELEAIFSGHLPKAVILIDDASCFPGRDGYPTLPMLKAYIHAKRPVAKIEIKHNIICVVA